MVGPFDADFPDLVNALGKKTSEIDQRYNCIAWAFGDNRRHWWPSSRSYWPMPFGGKSAMQAFTDWFAEDGWIETASADVEPGFTKVALYALNGTPTHASRLLPNGSWTSKLGANIDLAHGFNELDGPTYGSVIRIYKKASDT